MMTMIKRNVFESYTGIFEEYDKRRREQEFKLLKDVYKYQFGIDNVYEDCFEIPVFDKDKRKVFAIEIKNTKEDFRVSIYFKNSSVLMEYYNEYGEYIDCALTLNGVYVVMNSFIESMHEFLGASELFFTEITEDEDAKLFHETEGSYKKLERGIY